MLSKFTHIIGDLLYLAPFHLGPGNSESTPTSEQELDQRAPEYPGAC